MTFVVHCHPYSHDILFCLGGRFSDVARKFRALNMTPEDIKEFKSYFDSYSPGSGMGRTWHLSTGQQVIHMQVPMDAAGIALMGHEVLHAVSFILRKVGIEHTEETEEAYTYLHQYVMHQALKRVGRKYWK